MVLYAESGNGISSNYFEKEYSVSRKLAPLAPILDLQNSSKKTQRARLGSAIKIEMGTPYSYRTLPKQIQLSLNDS
jgi:hypothetical protein